MDEVHQNDRVASDDARQGDHADHARGREVDRIEESAHRLGAERVEQPEAGHDAQDRQRDRQHDDHRDGKRPRLSHQQHVNGNHRRAEGQPEVAEHVQRDFPLALAGKIHGEARRHAPRETAAVGEERPFG